MCVAGGKRCEYSDAINNVKKKTRSRLKNESSYERDEAVIDAVREFQESNPDLVLAHLPEKMGFQFTPAKRPVPQTLLKILGNKKEVVTGATAEDREKFYGSLFDRRQKLLASVNEVEESALHMYAGNAFEPINLYLRRKGYAEWAKRNGHLVDWGRGETHETYLQNVVKARAAGLDAALKKAPSPDEPEKVYRFFRVPAGVSPQEYIKRFLPKGGGFKDRGFMSTTADPEYVAAHIMDKSQGTRNKGYVVLEMLTDSGASLQPTADGYWGRVQDVEAEVLMPRNTGMRIIESATRKFEFADDRNDLNRRFGNWNSNYKIECDAGTGIRLPVVRMIDENLIRKYGKQS